jgi:hypothetical protein
VTAAMTKVRGLNAAEWMTSLGGPWTNEALGKLLHFGCETACLIHLCPNSVVVLCDGQHLHATVTKQYNDATAEAYVVFALVDANVEHAEHGFARCDDQPRCAGNESGEEVS